MREIKFRAWVESKASNKTWMNYDIEFIGGRINEHFNAGESRFVKITYMQYTGLKDKNGVEIYEHDILEWDEKEWGGPYREVVEWDYELLSMRQNDWSQFCKVVSNIHEGNAQIDASELKDE